MLKRIVVCMVVCLVGGAAEGASDTGVVPNCGAQLVVLSRDVYSRARLLQEQTILMRSAGILAEQALRRINAQRLLTLQDEQNRGILEALQKVLSAPPENFVSDLEELAKILKARTQVVFVQELQKTEKDFMIHMAGQLALLMLHGPGLWHEIRQPLLWRRAFAHGVFQSEEQPEVTDRLVAEKMWVRVRSLLETQELGVLGQILAPEAVGTNVRKKLVLRKRVVQTPTLQDLFEELGLWALVIDQGQNKPSATTASLLKMHQQFWLVVTQISTDIDPEFANQRSVLQIAPLKHR